MLFLGKQGPNAPEKFGLEMTVMYDCTREEKMMDNFSHSNERRKPCCDSSVPLIVQNG
jgi:hypothetical protein